MHAPLSVIRKHTLMKKEYQIKSKPRLFNTEPRGSPVTLRAMNVKFLLCCLKFYVMKYAYAKNNNWNHSSFKFCHVKDILSS